MSHDLRLGLREICVARGVLGHRLVRNILSLHVVYRIRRKRVRVVLVVNSAVDCRRAFFICGRNRSVTFDILWLIIQYLIVYSVLDIHTGLAVAG